jgi:hypothetical protein
MTPERRHELKTWWNKAKMGAAGGAILFVLGGVLVWVIPTFVTLPQPGNYVIKTVYDKAIKELQEGKVSTEVYAADKKSSDLWMRRMERNQDDLIMLHLDPRRTTERLIKERRNQKEDAVK